MFTFLFDDILSIFEEIQKSLKIVHLGLKFFFTKLNTNNFSKFQGLFNAKNLKKSFSTFIVLYQF
jgi:hypothetical protein